MIERSIRSKPSYLASVYNFAYAYKRKWTSRRFRCRLIDALLFQSLKNGLSNKLQIVFCGGSPLGLETSIFLKLHLNIKVSLAYGATETMVIAKTISDQFDHPETVSSLFFTFDIRKKGFILLLTKKFFERIVCH